MDNTKKDRCIIYDLEKDRFFCSNQVLALRSVHSGLLSLCIEVGYNCNLHCNYCSPNFSAIKK